jgi:hypothetical protein
LTRHMPPQPGIRQSINNFTNTCGKPPKSFRQIIGIHTRARCLILNDKCEMSND